MLSSSPDFHIMNYVSSSSLAAEMISFSENQKSHKISNKIVQKSYDPIKTKQTNILRLCVSHWGPRQCSMHSIWARMQVGSVHACVRFQAHALKSTTTELRSVYLPQKHRMNWWWWFETLCVLKCPIQKLAKANRPILAYSLFIRTL